MKVLQNMKLMYKLLLLALIPIILMGTQALIINTTTVKSQLIEDCKSELCATAKTVLGAYEQNAGDYFVNSAGDVWKGVYNVSQSTTFIDDIKAKTGHEITFFYGDRRLVTSIKDANNNRVIDSPAGEFLVQNVLTDGNDVFTNRVLVGDEFYFGYYIPVTDSTGAIVGMIFAGTPVEAVYGPVNKITATFVVTILLTVLLAAVIALFVSKSITVSLRDSMNVVQEIAEGNLEVEIPAEALARKDEVGQLSASTQKLLDSMSSMIGMVSANTENLNESSTEMSNVAVAAQGAMKNISDNLQDVLDAAATQTQSVSNIQSNIANINESIETTLSQVEQLKGAADGMLVASKEADDALSQLNDSNAMVLSEVENIKTQTANTNESVTKIRDSVSLITDIAEQTNLLSLNASIEAARAGEMGKGFAVVAQEISKLASQSNSASVEIYEIVEQLSKNSEESIATMGKVSDVIGQQTQRVSETAELVMRVSDQISTVADGVNLIRESTLTLSGEADSISADIKNLSDIAENNESTVKGTIVYSDEVINTVNSVTDMSQGVSASAKDMAGAVAQFRM